MQRVVIPDSRRMPYATVWELARMSRRMLTRREPAQSAKGMVLAIEPGIYWPGGGGLRLEDNFWITGNGNEKLCTFPDDFRLVHATHAGGTAR